MSLINIPFIFTPGTTIVSSQVNSCNSVIYNDYNGNIGNSNLSSSIVISDTKLAQITDASKVSATALTNMGSLPSGAGVIPVANIPVGTSVGNIVQLSSVNSGSFISTSLIGQLLGAWTSKSANTIYQASTDGFVVGDWANGSTGSVGYTAYSDSNSSPSTVRNAAFLGSQGTGNSYTFPICFPVIKNDYWEVSTSGGAATFYWIPLGS